MANVSPSPRLASPIRSLLAGLRWRIRAYILIEGFSLTIVWLGLTFWICLAMDYLPVLAGSSEMPVQARAVLLAVIGAGLTYIVYRWVLCRVLVQMADRSMAILLERRHRSFHDSLLTAVEMGAQPERAAVFNRQMLEHTKDEAISHLGDVRPRQVFNFSPLLRNLFGAVLVLVSVLVFHFAAGQPLAIWGRRLYTLSDEPWPRWAKIEVVGVTVFSVTQPVGLQGPPLKKERLMRFSERRVKVTKGSTPKLLVRADATREVVPQYCTLYFDTRDGDSGKVKLLPKQATRDGYQDYWFQREPLKGILSSIHFDVRGYDHRVLDYTIEAVDSPTMIDATLDCTFPDYLVDQARSLYLPRTIKLTAGMQLVQGAHIIITARSSKDLQTVYIYDTQNDRTSTLRIGGTGQQRRRFEYSIPNLQQNVSLQITLVDTDNLIAEKPQQISIRVKKDEIPTVNVALKGIGTAITPDARIPVVGQITDDHQIDLAWFQLEMEGASTRKYSLRLAKQGKVETALDLRDQRNQADNKLTIEPGDKLVLSVKTLDLYDLAGAPHLGSGDHYELKVVTADKLLALLEAREYGLRRRFEPLVEEMTQTHDSLLRVRISSADRNSGDAPGAEPEDQRKKRPESDTENTRAEISTERTRSLQLLRVQRAIQQSQKIAQEITGVAVSFEDIREELINNRVHSEERKQRLKQQIADPLHHIAKQMFPELDRRLKLLEGQFNTPTDTGPASRSAVEQADMILVQMDQVLQKMRDLETFNELVDLVRSLLENQDDLIQKTKKLRKKRVLDLQ